LIFSYDLTEGFEASESKLGKMTYNHFAVQKLFKEHGVIGKLIEVLDAINPDFFLKSVIHLNKIPLKMEGAMKILRKHGVGAKEGFAKTKIKV
jgi:hypothetical protein